MRFPDQPPNHNSPKSWLYYIKENWERMAGVRAPHWVNLSIDDGVDLVWGRSL